MNVKSIFCVLFMMLTFSVFSQQEDYIQTKGTIKNIVKKRSGKTVKELATVSFTTQKGEVVETVIELERIPVLGSLKSINDEITINYNKDNPALARTNVGSFISKYGMYILILLGVVFSARAYIQATKKQ